MPDISNLWRFDLRQGYSSNPVDGACLYDAISWFEYGELGDHPACSCDIIATFGRSLNDMLPHTERQRLKTYIPRLVGNVDPDARYARVEYLVWQAYRVFAPLILDMHGFRSFANGMRDFEGDFEQAGRLARSFSDAIFSRRGESLFFLHHISRSCLLGIRPNALIEAIEHVKRASEYFAVSAVHPRDKVYDALFAAFDGVIAIGKQAPAIEECRFETSVESFARARETV